jgi:hypothetical protein
MSDATDSATDARRTADDSPVSDAHVTAIRQTDRTLDTGSPGDQVTVTVEGQRYAATIDRTGVAAFAHEISECDAEGVLKGRLYGWLMLDPADAATLWDRSFGKLEAAVDDAKLEAAFNADTDRAPVNVEMDTAFQPVPNTPAIREDPRTVLIQTPRDPRVPHYPEQWPQVTVYDPEGDGFLIVADTEAPIRLRPANAETGGPDHGPERGVPSGVPRAAVNTSAVMERGQR